MSVIFAAKDDVTASAQVINIHVLRPSGWDEFKATLNTVQQNIATARQFSGKAGQMLHLPSAVLRADLAGAGQTQYRFLAADGAVPAQAAVSPAYRPVPGRNTALRVHA